MKAGNGITQPVKLGVVEVSNLRPQAPCLPLGGRWLARKGETDEGQQADGLSETRLLRESHSSNSSVIAAFSTHPSRLRRATLPSREGKAPCGRKVAPQLPISQ